MTLSTHSRLSAGRLGLAALMALLSTSVTAMAQTASQVTRESYAPAVLRLQNGALSLPATGGLQTPAGAETLTVTPSGLEVEGGLPALAGATAAIEARIAGRTVSAAELFAAARDLEAAYARAGYLLVRVSMPPQTLRDGEPLHIVVTDGFVDAIDASALPPRVRRRVEAQMAPLVGRTGLTKGEVERRLLLAGDTPGLTLRSTLKAGAQPGSTTIVLDGDHDLLTLTSGLDDSLTGPMGTWVATLGVDVNAALGMGEVFYARLAGHPSGGELSLLGDDPRNRQIVAGFTLPIGTDGVWLNLEAVDSRTHPTSDLGYTMADEYQRFSSRIGYTWLRSRDVNTSTLLVFDVAEEAQRLAIAGELIDFTLDRTRVVRLTQTGDLRTAGGGFLSGELSLSVGIDGLGARTGTAELPLSRYGAEPEFAKLSGSLSFASPIPNTPLHLMLSAKAQTSFGDPLVSSEQISLGGLDWVSAFGSGDFSGDAGAALRAEFSLPGSLQRELPFAAGATFGLSPYVFAAAGAVRLEQPTALEQRSTTAGALGTGLRMGLSQAGSGGSATLALEYAHGEASEEPGTDRFNLRFASRF